MNKKSLLQGAVRCALLLLSLVSAPVFSGEEWPNKPLRLVVPWPAGGIADLRGRLLGERLGKALGQPIVIENRPGADGTIGAYAVAQARADGYTLLYGSNIDQVIAPAVNRELPYEPLRDLMPIIVFGKSHLVLVAHPGVPARNMKEFMSWLKESRDSPAYSSGGNLHSAHFAGLMLQEKSGVTLLHVPYKGAAPALAAVMSGDVSFGFDFVATSLPMIEAGKVRALAIMGPKRLRLVPDVPSVDEVGLANMYAYTWGGIFVPKATPQSIALRLKNTIEKIASSPDLTNHVAYAGLEFDVRTGSDLTAFIGAEQIKWGNLIKAAGLKPE